MDRPYNIRGDPKVPESAKSWPYPSDWDLHKRFLYNAVREFNTCINKLELAESPQSTVNPRYNQPRYNEMTTSPELKFTYNLAITR